VILLGIGGELAVADLPSHHGCIVEFYVVDLSFGPRILAGKCRETPNLKPKTEDDPTSNQQPTTNNHH
jgi:hypothetical protein